MRIMTNYLQILAAALSYNLQFPTYVIDFLSSAKQVGNSSGVFLSFDWLLMETKATDVFDNIAYLKVLSIALLPLIFISAACLVYRLWFIHSSDKFKRLSWVTIITILFLIHPSITQYALRIFKCVDIGESISKVEMDITTDWWSFDHIKWIFGLCTYYSLINIAIPMLIFYVVGCPVAAFIILYTNRNQLDKPEVLKYIILLYQGLKHEMFYWELVNTLRKCLLLSFHVFIPDTLKTMKALFGVLTMFVISLAQSRLKPFKIEVISTLGKSPSNLVENREMVASLLTLYGGLIFSQKEQELSLLSIIFFILIILANCRFLILWIFWVSTVYKNKKVAELFGKWIKRAFCIKVNEVWYQLSCLGWRRLLVIQVKADNFL